MESAKQTRIAATAATTKSSQGVMFHSVIWLIPYECVCVSFCNCFCCYFFANTRLSIAISFIQPLCLFHCNNQKYAYLLFRTCFRTQRNTNIPSVHSKNAIFYVCYFTLPIILHYFYYVAINKHCMLNFFHFFFLLFSLHSFITRFARVCFIFSTYHCDVKQILHKTENNSVSMHHSSHSLISSFTMCVFSSSLLLHPAKSTHIHIN